jgi:rubrerythrin
MREGMRIESSATPDYVPFVAAGERAIGEYHCSTCGYGVSVQQRLPLCPMCRGVTWEPAAGPRLQIR